MTNRTSRAIWSRGTMALIMEFKTTCKPVKDTEQLLYQENQKEKIYCIYINQPRVGNLWQCLIVLGNPTSWLLCVLKQLSALAPLQISTPNMALAHFDVPNTGTLAGHCCVIKTAHWACSHAQHTLIGVHILNPNLPNKVLTCTAAMGTFKFNEHILN